MNSFQKILISSLLLIGLMGANLVYAQLVPCTGDDACTLCDLWQMGSNIINFITFDLSIPVAMLLFITAGVIFLISGGNQQRIDLARSIFTNTVIGLVIVFCSWLLVDTLFQTIAQGSFSAAWNDFPTCP